MLYFKGILNKVNIYIYINMSKRIRRVPVIAELRVSLRSETNAVNYHRFRSLYSCTDNNTIPRAVYKKKKNPPVGTEEFDARFPAEIN